MTGDRVVSRESPLIRADTDEVDIVALLRVVWRYKYFIAVVAIISGLVGIYLAMDATPIFRAEVVATEARSEGMNAASSLASQFGGLANIAGINLAKGGAAHESPAILRSRYLVEEFVRRNGLMDVLPNPKDPPSLWYAVNGFRESVLSIREDQDRGTTTVSIQWTDPVVAAEWANSFIALANEIIRTRALDDSSRNIAYLNEQISKTDVVDLRSVMYRLIESETRTLMLANARQEYAFTIVDPAVVPERRVWPRRTLMVLTAGIFGIFIGIFLAFVHNTWRRYRA